MYQTLLTTRYLTSRVIPLIAVAAVALCVALVIVVVSVMTGFLDMVQSAGRTLMGDVIISYGISGLPHYEDLQVKLEENPNILGTTPIVDGWGLLRMPYPDSKAKQSETVQVWGIVPESFAKITDFSDSLQWETPTENQRDWLLHDAITTNANEIQLLMSDDKWNTFVELINKASSTLNFAEANLWEDVQAIVTSEQWQSILSYDERLKSPEKLRAQGLSLSRNGKAGIISGLHVSDGNERQRDGTYKVIRNDYWWLPRFEGTLTMLPVDTQGGIIEPESIIMPFVNEFQSGVFMIDESRIFVPIATAQSLLHLDEAEIVDLDDPTMVLGIDPARATSILIRGIPGISAIELKEIVSVIYDNFRANMPTDTLVFPPSQSDPGLSINTWEDQQRSFTGPVEKNANLCGLFFPLCT